MELFDRTAGDRDGLQRERKNRIGRGRLKEEGEYSSKSKSILTPTVAAYPHSSVATLSLLIKFTEVHLCTM